MSYNNQELHAIIVLEFLFTYKKAKLQINITKNNNKTKAMGWGEKL